MKTLGICIGASTITLVHLTAPERTEAGLPDPEAPAPRVARHARFPHDGDPRRTLLTALERWQPETFDRFAATGRRFRQYVRLSQISETEAMEHAYRFTRPPGVRCPAIVSAGGESFMAYVLNGAGQVSNVLTGNKCASGTGEFFMQQLRRMNVAIEDVGELSGGHEPYRLSGRCSVFCKSDCTHATNKGVPVGRVTAGLCRMMAAKIMELLKSVPKENVMVTGGTVKNAVMLECLAEKIPGLIVPEEAAYFEALGAALWAADHETRPFPGPERLFYSDAATFERLAPLSSAQGQVTFKTLNRAAVRPGDVCVLGLDVGSTTTKAVLVRNSDNALLASIYLRTNGKPVEASRQCYREILKQIRTEADPETVVINGLGVCGSGRQIAGLHALTDGVINEIIAHATAAVYFDPAVDTIFEIGGQDAKYTYITNGVPSDYAMNEACSAGTGSFLEESALETLGIPMADIADIALKGAQPPNFNDQCAAFISSDIKTAIHDGIPQSDIVGGLVYSICMNYSNRVKGNRPVGEKVFMQGGVCYNRAVPLAMAAISGKSIVVPPEPGLMGAFGVALEIKKRIDAGLMAPTRFDLQALIHREVGYGKPFICKGGKDRCDRHCEIAVIELEGKRYPFGGACNRYYNLRRRLKYDMESLDLVDQRQKLIFASHAPAAPAGAPRGRVGINRSFLVNTYFPMYDRFFKALGFETVLPEAPTAAGIDQRDAPFCYPAELAHGFFDALLRQTPPPEYIFLPHFKAVPALNGGTNAQVCPFVQGETYFLRTAFAEAIADLRARGVRVLAPVLNLTNGLDEARKPLLETAREMGVSRKEAEAALDQALSAQRDLCARMQALGRETLAALAEDPEQTAVAVFGRPYNAFVEEAHMGIPRKLASRGIRAIPIDFLPLEGEPVGYMNMYWGMGQLILKAARYVQRHPSLFGVYITNFSCGPDSFLMGYFRDVMGRKPSLTLELDSHTADAGLETRIEAFLDVVTAYRRRQMTQGEPARPRSRFFPARTALKGGRPAVITSGGETIPLTDPRVKMIVPSMGRFSSEALAAAFRWNGIATEPLPPADDSVLKLGRANTSCKECLPLQLTTGAFLKRLEAPRPEGEALIYFMATAAGPCRFGQYRVFMDELIRKRRIPDVALFSLSGENAYIGMKSDFVKRSWWAVVASDAIEDIRAMLLAGARQPEAAMEILESCWSDILFELEYGTYPTLEAALEASASVLAGIPLKRPAIEVPVICLTGEIFVRRDGLSRRYLTEELAKKGFATTCSPIAEWLIYCDYLYERGYTPKRLTLAQTPGFMIKKHFMHRYERRIKSLLSRSGLIHAEPIDIPAIMASAAPYIKPHLTCETILTVGSALMEIATHVCGVIAIGPFGCMPNRLAEAILNKAMVREGKLGTDPANQRLRAVLSNVEDLPFLAVETDGSPFPQLINAKLETFCLRAERLHRQMRTARFN